MNHNLSRSVKKIGLTLRKNIPTITTVLGVAGIVGTGILSARAAYKSAKTVDEHKKKMEQLRANKESFETSKEYNKEVVAVYTETGKGMAKVYWPAIAVGAASIASVIVSHRTQKKRYLAMTGLYMASLKAYDEYRKRVAEKYGVEAERDLYLDRQTEEIVTVTTNAKGKEKTSVETVKKAGLVQDDTYSILLIDTTDKAWFYGRPEQTYYLLETTGVMLTEKLRRDGYLFLNDVLEAIDKPRVPAGQYIGWLYDPDKSEGDNAVDFGLKETSPYYDPENVELFLKGKNDYVYITLNHDGTILDRFPQFDRYRVRNAVRQI